MNFLSRPRQPHAHSQTTYDETWLKNNVKTIQRFLPETDTLLNLWRLNWACTVPAVRCVNTLKKISVRMWMDGEQVKDKVRGMTVWWCATSSSFIVALRRMMVKVLILALFPLKQLHALAVIITDQHSAMPFNQSMQEGPLDLKLQRPTRLLPTYTM